VTEFSSGPISLSLGVRKRDPESDRARLRAIHDTLQAGDVAAAGQMAAAALAAGLEHPMLFNLAADRLEREQRYEDALALLQQGYARAPQDLGLNQALGLCLHRLERPAEALAHFDAVLAAQPAFAPGHAARGGALEAIGDIRGAEAAYARAVELQPQSLIALSGLASIASRRGRHAEARALAERVVAGEPGYPDAVMVLAEADLADGLTVESEARLRRLMADPRVTPVQRALAEGLLGDAFDAQGRTAEAFGAYSACNAALAQAYAPRFAGAGDALVQARRTLALLDTLPQEAWSPGPQAPAGEARAHVFLVGFPRSGTTLLEQVLASHPDVEALEERDTLADAVEAFPGADGLAALAAAPQAEITRLRAAYWRRVAREGAQAQGKLFVDKMPLNTFRLPMIAKLFPEAKVLFARRDPRDVVLSCFRRRFAINAPMYQLLSLSGAAAFYDMAMQIGDRLGRELKLATLVVRHESLVEDFDAVAGEVCAFLDLPFTAELRDFAQRVQDRGIATPSGAQLAGGLTAEGLGAWRRYAAQMADVLPTLRPWVKRFGYPAD